jgi:hypothetical protein
MSVYTHFYKKVFLPENQQSLIIVDSDGNSYTTTAHYGVDFIGEIKNFESLNEILIEDMGFENKVVELSLNQLKSLLSKLRNIMDNNWMTESETHKTNQFFQWANEHIKKDEPFYGKIGFLYCLEIN